MLMFGQRATFQKRVFECSVAEIGAERLLPTSGDCGIPLCSAHVSVVNGPTFQTGAKLMLDCSGVSENCCATPRATPHS